MLFLLFTLCLFVSLDFLVILVFSAERVASIARVNSARRRNNNFARRSRGTRTRRFRGARASQRKRENERRTTQNCKKQNRVTRDTALGQASPREAPLAPHLLLDRARTNRAAAANRELRKPLDRLGDTHTRALLLLDRIVSFLLPSTVVLPSARRLSMTHARP